MTLAAKAEALGKVGFCSVFEIHEVKVLKMALQFG